MKPNVSQRSARASSPRPERNPEIDVRPRQQGEPHDEPTVSVVVCTYSEARWDDLVACLQSLEKQTLPPTDVHVVVDHNPTLLRRVNELGVTALENRELRGLSGARNTGVQSTRGELVAFLDDDAIADPEWLEHLAHPFADPRVLGTGGYIEPLWMAQSASWFPPEFYWVVGCSHRGMPSSSAPIRNPFGASMCIRRSVFETVGGFHTGMGRTAHAPMGCEETELCIRARQRWPDGRFVYVPDSRVQHRVPSGRTSWRYFVSRCYAEGRSKALVSSSVGTSDALSTERTYTMRTLPIGFLRGVTDALWKRDATGMLRSAAIVAGLTSTVAGYAVGSGPFRASSF